MECLISTSAWSPFLWNSSSLHLDSLTINIWIDSQRRWIKEASAHMSHMSALLPHSVAGSMFQGSTWAGALREWLEPTAEA